MGFMCTPVHMPRADMQAAFPCAVPGLRACLLQSRIHGWGMPCPQVHIVHCTLCTLIFLSHTLPHSKKHTASPHTCGHCMLTCWTFPCTRTEPGLCAVCYTATDGPPPSLPCSSMIFGEDGLCLTYQSKVVTPKLTYRPQSLGEGRSRARGTAV